LISEYCCPKSKCFILVLEYSGVKWTTVPVAKCYGVCMMLNDIADLSLVWVLDQYSGERSSSSDFVVVLVFIPANVTSDSVEADQGIKSA